MSRGAHLVPATSSRSSVTEYSKFFYSEYRVCHWTGVHGIVSQLDTAEDAGAREEELPVLKTSTNDSLRTARRPGVPRLKLPRVALGCAQTVRVELQWGSSGSYLNLSLGLLLSPY